MCKTTLRAAQSSLCLQQLYVYFILIASGNGYRDYYNYYQIEYPVDIVNDLIAFGASLNIQNNAGETAAVRGYF